LAFLSVEDKTYPKVIAEWVLACFKVANIVFIRVDYNKEYDDCKGKRDRLSKKIQFLKERQSDLDKRYQEAFSECVNMFQTPPESKATAEADIAAKAKADAESKAAAEANAASEAKSAAEAAEKDKSSHTRTLLEQL